MFVEGWIYAEEDNQSSTDEEEVVDVAGSSGIRRFMHTMVRKDRFSVESEEAE